MKKELPKNTFHDINKLPTTEGIILFGISMSRIGNAQNPKKCFEYLKHLASKIQYTDGIGMVIFYGDYLYLNSEDPAHTLRDRFMTQMVSHKNAFMRLLEKDRVWTHKAFSFVTFGQLVLDNADIFQKAYATVQNLYAEDKLFREYVTKDCASTGHGDGERNITFILEEITMFYLCQKGLLKLGNSFVADAEKNWILQAYPGDLLKSEVYLFKKNPLNLSNPENRYENSFYDLEKKRLYEYGRIDLERL